MSERVVKLSHLLGARVVDQGGADLGRVYDVRVRQVTAGEPGRPPDYEVEGLLVGARGLVARIGLIGSRRSSDAQPVDPVPWSDVVALESGRVVVRSRA
jgi:sporulation protein YlmC with PRC-barrel domain